MLAKNTNYADNDTMKSHELINNTKSRVAIGLLVAASALAGCGEKQQSDEFNPDEIISVTPHYKKTENLPQLVTELPVKPADVSCKSLDFSLDPTTTRVVTAPDTGTYAIDFVSQSAENGIVTVTQKPEGSDLPISISNLSTDSLGPHSGQFMRIPDTYPGAFLDVLVMDASKSTEQIDITARLCAPTASQQSANPSTSL